MSHFDVLQFLKIRNVPQSMQSKLKQEHEQLISNYLFIKITDLFSEEELKEIHSADQLIQQARIKFPDFDLKVAVFLKEYQTIFLQKQGGLHV